MEKKNMGLFLVAMAVAVAVSGVEGQTNPPSCAASLVPCQDYLNATTPSDECCSSLRNAVRTDLPCLCDLFQDEDLFRAFRINMTQALELPRRCGITQGIDACNAAGNWSTPFLFVVFSVSSFSWRRLQVNWVYYELLETNLKPLFML